ncbi:DUF4829 domain-containing protein [Clostridium sp. UBA6640]|uniref:DUF4829 domain-containing protein n=1 Tax=Clostridium sp. UBA6640 TaxID=1946370 RepID=UPI0025C6F986|nr:DUF4829 domain-containing protein [Clostridium sp. UBA6640]
MNKIKVKFKVIIISLAILICAVLIKPWDYYLQSERYIENNVIRKYYRILDEERDVDKYNFLVISSRRRENFNNIPDAVEKRDILNVEKLEPQEHDVLKQYIKEEYEGKEDKVRFYFVEYDIKFKEGVATPVDSGRYCIVVRLEKEHGKWLINDNYSRAVKKNDGTIEIIS